MTEEDSNIATIGSRPGGLPRVLAELEHKLALLDRQVAGLQRLAALGTMSAMLAHEFNNLLTPLVSYAQYALSRGRPDELKAAVERSLRTAERLGGLCGRIMGMAAGSPDELTNIEIERAAREAVECLGRDPARDGICLTIESPSGLSARAAAGSLQQVLFNIVLNARQAMIERGGRLMIRARRQADRVVIDVTDTGPGIAPEHIPHIFEPFFTTRPAAGSAVDGPADSPPGRPDKCGLGLGLHVCKRLMQDMGGSIDVASVPGEGTTFTLQLPAA
jgi:C4-dicarboxylate-specific signal transduction histidine kinase